MEQSVLRVSFFISVVSHCARARRLFGGVQNGMTPASPHAFKIVSTSYELNRKTSWNFCS